MGGLTHTCSVGLGSGKPQHFMTETSQHRLASFKGQLTVLTLTPFLLSSIQTAPLCHFLFVSQPKPSIKTSVCPFKSDLHKHFKLKVRRMYLLQLSFSCFLLTHLKQCFLTSCPRLRSTRFYEHRKNVFLMCEITQ